MRFSAAIWLALAIFQSQTSFASDTHLVDGTLVTKDKRGTVINDSLVYNLSCEKLNPHNALTALRGDAFSSNYHIPLTNWNANSLGQCWALSLTQREYFYLLRFNSISSPTNLNSMLYLSGQVSPNLRTIPIKGSCLNCKNGIFDTLLRSGFKDRIEQKQQDRFYTPGNIGLVIGPRKRSEAEDADSLSTILSDLRMGRMPLVDIRGDVSIQHVILIKSVRVMGPQSYVFTVYDSNNPHGDSSFFFYKGRFYAPNILSEMTGDISSPVGLFIQDEDEMDNIQTAVYQHYADVCQFAARLPK